MRSCQHSQALQHIVDLVFASGIVRPHQAGETGARLVLPAGSGVAFDFFPAFHQEEFGGEAGLVIRPVHTPGHTPEHVSYLVLIDGQPVALFSGGSLLVGSAGRSDLLGQPRARMIQPSSPNSAQTHTSNMLLRVL